MKTCKKCGVEKEESEFYKGAQNKDGLKSWCKECCASYAKKYNLENSHKFREYQKTQRIKNADILKERQAKYRNENRDLLRSKYSEAGKKYRLKYPEKAALKQKRHYENLNDFVITKSLKRIGLSEIDIKENPELIEIKRIIIKTKRLCKTLKN